MKKKIVAITAAVTVAFSTSPAFALDLGYLLDLSAPSVKAFTGSTTLLNQGNVGLQATITDDLSGVAEASVVFKTPETQQNRVVTLQNTSGDIWAGDLVIAANDEEGTWQVSEVTAKDKAGHVAHATVTFSVVVDQTPPNPPQVDQVTDQSTKVTGKSNVNESIAIKVAGVTIANGPTDATGKYSIAIPVQKAGTEIAVTTIDQATNESNSTKVIVKDVTKPAPPVVEEVVRACANKVHGTTEPKATIKAKVGGNVVASVKAGDDGAFILQPPYLKEGTVVQFTATDEAGNESDPVTRTLVDGTPPPMPSIYVEITDQTTTLTGSAEAGSTIKVKANGTVIYTGTLAAGATYYTATIPKQKAGTLIEITATDANGNESMPSKITVTSTDKTAPAAPVVQLVTEQSTVVKGQAEAGSTVTVKSSATGQLLGQGTADASGKFEIAIPAQAFGTSLFVNAKDEAGNVSVATKITVKGIVNFPVKEEGATAKVFTDLDSVPWALDAISEMSTIGIVKGKSDTEFDPNNNVTRAEFASLMVRTLGLTGQGTNPFKDVTSEDWFMEDVSIAYKYGIITGISSTEFAPNDPITREEMATMIVRAMRVAGDFKANNVYGTLSQYADYSLISDWAGESVAIASEKGLVKGVENNCFSPDTKATRAQAAVIIYRFYQLFNN